MKTKNRNSLPFWKTMTMKDAERLAKRCKTSPAYLRQIAYGHRNASAQLALRIDRLTSGEWSKEMIRPDIYF